jgi:salicylate hydroxylase
MTFASKGGVAGYTLHRSDLHRALVGVIPADRLHLAHRLTELLNPGDRVETRFENGASVSADALIGADGIHSVVRRALFGPEKPRFTGCVAHRGIVSADRLSHLGLEFRNQIWMGPGRHFVH